MQTMTVALLRYDKDGRTCSRCEETARVIERVVKRMTTALRNIKVDLVYTQVPLPEERIAESNTVTINGKDVGVILAEGNCELTSCPWCSEMLGKEVQCKTFTYKGQKQESVSEEMLQEAILAELPTPTAMSRADAIAKVICDCKDECSGTHKI